ncbi:Holliday junction ATP-dependent DNA helicase RuvB [bioreactor metagenome]|uniref:DNA-directed DNA polymerase n=1 Tax=bioreactor metagenome TaxID=1076179 RepID=A0A644YJN3_9ZZZZ
MAYLALYRQHRPKKLDEIVEQSHIVRALSNAITEQRLSHSYLFAGPRGTGKTSVARILARSLNCEQGPTLQPCGVCASCKSIDQGTSMDVREIDAASNRNIDDIRNIRQNMQYMAESRYKIYIIDEVHMLNDYAFNAFLKTLEEPPPNTLFILATTEAHKIPLTILSRCQRYDFRRISTKGIMSQIQKISKQESLEISAEALKTISGRAEGCMRDALSLLDQCLSFAGNHIELDDVLAVLGSVDQKTLICSIEAMIYGDIPKLLQLLDLIEAEGKDLVQFLRDLLLQLKEWLTEKPPIDTLLPEQIVELLQVLSTTEWEMKQSTQPRLSLELAMFRAGDQYRAGDRLSVLESKIRALEALSKISNSTEDPSPVDQGNPKQAVMSVEVKSPEVRKPEQVEQVVPISKESDPAKEEEKSAKPLRNDEIRMETWDQILMQVFREKISAHAILKQGKVYRRNGNTLEVLFQNDFHKKIMEKEDNKQAIERALKHHLGEVTRFVPLLPRDIQVLSSAEPLQTQEDWLIQAAIQWAGKDKVEIASPQPKENQNQKG